MAPKDQGHCLLGLVLLCISFSFLPELYTVSPKGGSGRSIPLFTVFMQHRIVAMYLPRHNSFKVVISPPPLIFNHGGNTVISPGHLVASTMYLHNRMEWS